MVEDEPTWSEEDENHPMTRMMNCLVEGHRQLCAEAEISPWDFCVMLANVQGLILGQSEDMPTDTAIARIGELGKLAILRIHEERAPPTSGSIA